MLEPVRFFLSYPFGWSVIGLAVVSAGLLAGWMEGRRSDWSRRQLVLAAAAPAPLVCLLLTAALLIIAPWDDQLITAVLLTAGVLGTIFSLIAGLLAAWLVTAGLKR